MLKLIFYFVNLNKTYTFTHPKLKVSYMIHNEVTADNYGITFTLPPTGKYTIGRWQIEQDGFTKWHSHLQEKHWFSDTVRRRFTDLCVEHFNWN